MKITVKIVNELSVLFLLILFLSYSCGGDPQLPDYKDEFLEAQKEFDESQKETFEEMVDGHEKLKEGALEAQEAIASGSGELPDVEVLRARWQTISSSVEVLNSTFVELGRRGDEYFNALDGRVATLLDDTDRESIKNVIGNAKAEYALKTRRARNSLDELDRVIEKANNAITKIEIATSLTQISSLLDDFDGLNNSITEVQQNIIEFTEETENVARNSMGI